MQQPLRNKTLIILSGKKYQTWKSL